MMKIDTKTGTGRCMTFSFSVPTPSGTIDFQIEPGTSLLFVGANGGGKTRLAVQIENELRVFRQFTRAD
jgi:ABC-type Mn2+/Zn2+ transport system ATPase subunit